MSENDRGLLEQFMYIQRLLLRCYHHGHKIRGFMGNSYRGQGRVLKLLKMQPEISQKDLAELLDMRPQSLGELLAKLENTGFVTRGPSDSDKRIMIVRLTEKGAEAGSQDADPPVHDALFSCLSEEEQTNLSEYLSRIIGKLEAESSDGQNWPGFQWHDHGRERGCEHHDHGNHDDYPRWRR